MLKRNWSILAGILLFAGLTSLMMGCAKDSTDEKTAAELAGDALTRMLDSFQIALPDGSYGTDSPLNNFPVNLSAGSTVKDLKLRVDAVAVDLKESNLQFGKVLREGKHENNNLTVTHEDLKASLIGESADGKVNWTFKKNDISIFTGTTSEDGLTGSIFFSAPSLDVEWSYGGSNAGAITKTVTIRRRGGGGNLLFEYSFSSNGMKVKLTNGFANNEGVTGEWDKSTGFTQVGGAAQPKCSWGSSLQNTGCK